MADLSADRPLPLPEKQFTEEDVADLAEFLCGIDNDYVCQDCTDQAHNAFSYLAAAGRLLPPDVEHREEWNVRLPKPGGYSIVDDSMTKTWPPEPGEIRDDVAWWKEHASLDVIPVKRSVTQFGDGSWLTGPWVEVDGSPEKIAEEERRG